MKFYNWINPLFWMDFLTFYGGGKGGGTPAQQTAYNVQMPESLVPYAEDIAKQAQRLSAREYVPYGAERIAGMTDAQRSALEQTKAMGPSAYFPAAGLAALQSTQMGMQPGQFGAEQAAQYMSPYQQAVTDIAKRQATSEAERMRANIAGRAQKAGAFGGSRYGLMEGKLYSDLGQRLSDIQTRGSQQAFQQAQQQFERDRAARQQAARLGLAGAQQLTATGGAQQQAEIQRLRELQRAGTLEQGEAQRLMDLRYQDFLRQQDYPVQQLGQYSALIRGLQPISATTTQAYQTPVSPFQQLLGLGIAGLGAYGAMRG